MINHLVFLFIDELELKGAGNCGGKGEWRDETAGKGFGGIEYCGGMEFPDANTAHRKFSTKKKDERIESVFADSFVCFGVGECRVVRRLFEMINDDAA